MLTCGRAGLSPQWTGTRCLQVDGTVMGGGGVSVTALCGVSVKVDRQTVGGEWDITRLRTDDSTVTDYSGTVWSAGEG